MFTPMMNKIVTALVVCCLWQGVAFADVFQNKWGMTFVKIPAGEFNMGLADREEALMEVPGTGEIADEGGLKDELPLHRVVISKDFYMAKVEVNQHQWLEIMENKPGPEINWQRDSWKQLPVVSTTWFMVKRFIEEINLLDKQYTYRLPTEAEWEYVAHAGSEELRPVPIEELEDYAWFIHNSGDRTQPVGSKKPNSFGVHDMLGNVWEWVADWYAADAYSLLELKDPTGPEKGLFKVRKGGSFHCPLHLMRPGYRGANRPADAYAVTGFRLIAEIKP